MKCIFCKNPAGLLKSYHEDCYDKIQMFLRKMEQIVNQYNQESITAKDAKNQLVSLASSDCLYKNYLEHEILDKTAIRTNETVIYIENMVSISESKNRCKMVETGYRYEKMPTWNETNQLIGENVSIVFTDKSIYMLLNNSAMMYPYNKIVNLGYDEKQGDAYFDLKTSSPYPHRFSIKPFIKKDKSKAQNVCLFLKCLIGY